MKEFNSFNNISTATTTLVRTGAGTLLRVTLNEPATGAITVFDSLTGAGDTIATIASGTVAGHIDYNCRVATGITIVTAMADDVTVVFSD